MIRYPVSRRDLETRVDAAVPGWRARAAERTAAFVTAGRYNEEAGIWSEVKTVFLKLQYNKCAYCERRLAGPRFGLVEHDVEHFRPKSRVRAWPTPQMERTRGIRYDFSTGAESAEGYYRLAYHLRNYATACKTCNTALKSDYFPIAKTRIPGAADPRDLAEERCFLVYPLGDEDTDPARLITFAGVLPVPVARSGHARRRAQVTIDFFELDTREELLRERAEQIRALYLAREVAECSASVAKRQKARQAVDEIISPYSPHASCARSFDALLSKNSPRAERIAAELDRYIVPQL